MKKKTNTHIVKRHDSAATSVRMYTDEKRRLLNNSTSKFKTENETPVFKNLYCRQEKKKKEKINLK